MNAAIGNRDLASKVAFVTGAASGIGRAAALAASVVGAEDLRSATATLAAVTPSRPAPSRWRPPAIGRQPRW